MKVSELIEKLKNVLENEGDLNIYVDDMKPAALELCETIDRDDVAKYGTQYLSIC